MKLTTPVSILIVGVLIAGTILFTNLNETSEIGAQNVASPIAAQEQVPPAQPEDQTKNVLPISKEDHVRGSKNAKVTIVEYSDYECPFCKRFHDTMKSVIEERGDEVAWVYRHFPLEQLHPEKARKEALAAECAADQKGSEGFWEFSDRFFELTPSNNRTDLDVVLPQIAGEIGLDIDEFNSCVDTEKLADKVDRDAENAVATGGRGTPWSVVIADDGTTFPLNGAQPAVSINQIIDAVLAN